MKSLVVKLIVGIFVFALGAFSALWATTVISGSGTETRSTQIVNSVSREEQVVLLSLGIQGIDDKVGEKSKFFGMFEIPGSERTKFIRYGFDAKLGIDGKDVLIEQTGENEFLVTIPEFIFIGHDNPNAETAIDKNGALSWLTPEIDGAKLITDILNNPETKSQYISKYEEILKDQAKVFYSSIITSIDPTVVLTFTFRQ
ncbi:hypothetical protein [Homoserinimonas sp. OAct 916]|uniref:hypothetical protein n=1 Tax=Homoserinimonas sp. OAct 916 TaxID=2211450 RepID=UPI000DBE1607|nr:hypothetical protein [Homoserinimonas sp. OAct 916]